MQVRLVVGSPPTKNGERTSSAERAAGNLEGTKRSERSAMNMESTSDFGASEARDGWTVSDRERGHRNGGWPAYGAAITRPIW
jgi:hypothetical protein